jgi:hypothetical protein
LRAERLLESAQRARRCLLAQRGAKLSVSSDENMQPSRRAPASARRACVQQRLVLDVLCTSPFVALTGRSDATQ